MTLADADWILDPSVADWIWDYVKQDRYLYWPEDQRLTYMLSLGYETETYYRDGRFEPEAPMDWLQKNLRMVDTPMVDFMQDKVKGVRIAGTPYTTLGSWFTFELAEETPYDVDFVPIRVPVTDDMVDDVKRWAQEEGGTVTRTKGVEFNERFATAFPEKEASRAAGKLRDVHVKIEGVTTEASVRRIFRRAAEFATDAVVAVTDAESGR